MVITDMVSFYTLPSTVMSHPTHNKLKAAYSFYNVSTVTPWVDLIGDALVLAKKVISVYNSFYLFCVIEKLLGIFHRKNLYQDEYLTGISSTKQRKPMCDQCMHRRAKFHLLFVWKIIYNQPPSS